MFLPCSINCTMHSNYNFKISQLIIIYKIFIFYFNIDTNFILTLIFLHYVEYLKRYTIKQYNVIFITNFITKFLND